MRCEWPTGRCPNLVIEGLCTFHSQDPELFHREQWESYVREHRTDSSWRLLASIDEGKARA